MLFLVFQLGADRYAIEAARVVEVLPLVNLKQLPGAPPEIAGILDYHGAPVPALDLSQFALGVPSRRLMSTRIILVTYEKGAGPACTLGLIAEHVTETFRCAESEFVSPGVSAAGSPYLGSVAMAATGILQRVDIGALFSDGVGKSLLSQQMVPL